MINILEIFKNLNLGEIMEFLLETEEKYKQFISELNDLPDEFKKAFFSTIKETEDMASDNIENIDIFHSRLNRNIRGTATIDTLSHSLIDNDYLLNLNTLQKIHREVLFNQDKNPGELRTNEDDIWVGTLENGERKISFIPPNADDLPNYLNQIIEFYNETYYKDEKQHALCSELSYYHDHPFIKSAVLHSFIIYIQAFKDGNKRLARKMQTNFLCQRSNEYFNTDFPCFPLNLSKGFLNYKHQYITLTDEIHNNFNDNELWSKWFKLNLIIIDEQIYYLSNVLEQYKNNLSPNKKL